MKINKQQYQSTKLLDKISTSQIKQGLQRIKFSQEQLLKQLKNYSYRNSPRQNNHFKHLEKTQQQIQKLKKDLSKQKQKSQIKIINFIQRINFLEEQVNNKINLQISLTNQIKKLRDDNYRLEKQNQNKQIQLKNYIKSIQKYQYDITNLDRQYYRIKNDLEKCQQNFQVNAQVIEQKKLMERENTRLEKQVEYYIQQYEEIKRKIDKDKVGTNKNQNNSRTIQNQQKKKSIQVDKIILEIKKINENHDRFYDRIKSITTVSEIQLDLEDQYQNIFNRTINLLESLQKRAYKKYNLNNGDLQQSAILGKYQTEGSFRDDFKKLQRQLFGNEQKKQMQPKYQYIKLKQQMRNYHLIYQNDKKIYQSKIEDLKKQLKQQNNKYLQLYVQHSKLKQQSKNLQHYQEIKQENIAFKNIMEKYKHQKTILLAENQELKQQLKDYKFNQGKTFRKQGNLEDKWKDQEKQYCNLIEQLKNQVIQLENEKGNLLKIVNELKTKRPNENKQIQNQINKVIQMNNDVHKENQNLLTKINFLTLEIQSKKMEKNKIETLMKQSFQKLKIISIENDRIRDIIKMIEQEKNQHIIKIRQLQQIILNNQYNYNLKVKRYQIELQNKTRQLVNLHKQNQTYIKTHRQLTELKVQYDQLDHQCTKICRNAKQIDSIVDHLWGVKQAQYQNINALLKILKKHN